MGTHGICYMLRISTTGVTHLKTPLKTTTTTLTELQHSRCALHCSLQANGSTSTLLARPATWWRACEPCLRAHPCPMLAELPCHAHSEVNNVSHSASLVVHTHPVHLAAAMG